LLNGKRLELPDELTIIMLNKPAGYVCSRDGQGSRTVYDLLPPELHGLKPVGRLDKDSSGLLLLTDDGNFANELTHPSKQKEKVYTVELDKKLAWQDRERIERGVERDDGVSALRLRPASPLRPLGGTRWDVRMSEGRNRQIRRTFAACGYDINSLHRTTFGPYRLNGLKPGSYISL
jgi:pseudouridine synthase